jgi:hypothetical protein
MFFYFLSFYNLIYVKILSIAHNSLINFLFKSQIILRYFHLNELIWQEGLLIDFLQKKIIDNWIRRFLISSAYLFNERFLFDKIVRFYLDLIIWPLHSFSIFEFNNVSNILFIILYFFVVLLFSLIYFYLFSFLF